MAAFIAFFLSFAIRLEAVSQVCNSDHGFVGDGCLDDEAASFLQVSMRATVSGGDVPTGSYEIPGSAFSDGNVSALKGNLSTNLSSLVNSSQKPKSKVKPFDCHKMKRPLQLIGSESGYDVKTLNISTGAYQLIFSIPFDKVPYTSLNACGISPKDDKIYCAMFAEGSYVVRFDEKNIEFVARLPWFNNYVAGGFSPAGNFYVATYYMEIIVVKNLHQATGYEVTERNGDDIIDLRKKKLLYPTGFLFGADIIGVNMNLQKKGLEEYIVVLHGRRLQIAKYDNVQDIFKQVWVIFVRPPRNDNIYGAGWNYQNKVYWAANNGNGVYQIPWEEITPDRLNNGFPPGFELQLVEAGSSDAVSSNDGMNCVAEPDPWSSRVHSFPCKEFPGMIQAMITPDGYDVKALDYKTGRYTKVYSIAKTRTNPPIQKLNAFSIGPISSVVYATLVMDDWNDAIYPTPPPFYIVRLDETHMEFVAKVQAPFGQPIAGTHDGDGHYWVLSNPSLLKIPLSHALQGFANPTNPELPFFGPDSSIIAIKNLTGVKQIADIVQIYANFDGQGRAKWLLGVNHLQQFLAIKLGNGRPQHWILPTNDVIPQASRQNFGSAWYFGKDQFYVASNDGFGVFHVDLTQIGTAITGYHEEDGDCTGGDLEIFDNSDGSACLDSCDQDPECFGYEVSTKYQECVTVKATCKRTHKKHSLFYRKKVGAGAKPFVKLTKVGDSGQVENNDGMNCRPERVKRTEKVGCVTANCQKKTQAAKDTTMEGTGTEAVKTSMGLA